MGDSSSGPYWPPPDDAEWQGFTPHDNDPYGDPYGPAAPGAGTGATPAVGGPGGPGEPPVGGSGGGDGEGDGDEPARRFGLTRRQALGILGATGVVGAGLFAGRRLF